MVVAELRSLRETPMIMNPCARRRRSEAALRLGTAAVLLTVFLVPTGLAAQRREPIPSPFAPLGIERMSELATQVVAGTHRKDGVNLEPRPFADLHPGNDAGRAGAVGSGREADRFPDPGRHGRGNHGHGFGDAALPGGRGNRGLPARHPGAPAVGPRRGRGEDAAFPARTMGASACCFRSRPPPPTKRAGSPTNSTTWRVSCAATPSADRAGRPSTPTASTRTAWNAGFSRHSPPQAGGGTTSFAGMAQLRVRPLGLAMNRPRPCGPLCRLKPAFQAGGVIPARVPSRRCGPPGRVPIRGRRSKPLRHSALEVRAAVGAAS